MRLLLTRALDDARRTRSVLESAGHSVFCSPVIEFRAVKHDWPDGAVDAIAATSAQAFQALRGTLRPTAEGRRVLPGFVVGERTAAVARRCGFAGRFSVQPDAAHLATAIADAKPRVHRIAYAAGRDRKSTLELGLTALGIRVETIVVYEAAAASISDMAARALRDGRLDGVLHFSRRSAALFLEQIEKAGLDAKPAVHVCLSDDVARPIRDARYERIIVAREPTEASLIAALPRSARD